MTGTDGIAEFEESKSGVCKIQQRWVHLPEMSEMLMR
jgi:hypothetical protein